MKGTLTKLDNQWMVRYDTFQNDHSYPLPAYNFLPLHPDYVKYYFLDEDAEGGEVEFEWCVILQDGKGKEYARLTKPKRIIDLQNLETKLHQALSEETDWTLSKWLKSKREDTTEKSANKSWEGCDGCTEAEETFYLNGYVRGYNAAIADLPKEISDEEIEKAAYQEATFAPSFIRGIQWYREQLKKK